MISKETFVATMEKLQEIDKKMDAVDEALKVFNKDFCGFYFPDVFDIVIELLEEDLNDEEEWISFFVYEMDWLRGFKKGNVLICGNEIDINNWGDVYDLIIKRGDKK